MSASRSPRSSLGRARSRRSSAAGAAIASVLAAGVMLGACGGKVSHDSWSSSSGDPAPIGTERPPPHPTPSAGMTTAAIAAEIAATYCKTFSSCCVAAGQPPVDVARCRELTSSAVEERLDRSISAGAALPGDIVAPCVQAISARMSACGAVDAKWWDRGDLALFGPESVQLACASILGAASGGHGARCEGAQSCPSGNTCAVDECIADSGAGEPCAVSSDCRLDGLVCERSQCVTQSGGVAGAACASDDDCRLGLVCASKACAPAREHPDLYKERSSPYRVGLDTCQALSSL